MSVDTATERYSVMEWGYGTEAIQLPEPDNTISRGDRLFLMGLYAGIEAAEDESGVTDYKLSSRNISNFGTFTDTTSSEVLTVIGPVHFALGGVVERVNFSIKLIGGDAVALDAFQVECQIDNDGQWIVMQNTWGADGDESGFILHTPDDLENLGHDTVGMAILNPVGLRSLRFKSALASTPTEAITRVLEISSVIQARNR